MTFLSYSIQTKIISYIRLFVTPWAIALQAPLSMGILQARILGWGAMPSSRGSSQPRDKTQVSYIAGNPGSIPGLGKSVGHREPTVKLYFRPGASQVVQC